MAASTFFIPSVNVIGADSLDSAMNMMAEYGFRRTLIVTDSMLTQLGMAGDVQKALEERNIFSVIYDGTQPNPTTENVAAGLKLLKENDCDSVISLGGGSPHDCAKSIALVAANGGDIRDYEGVDRSAKPQLPMIAENLPLAVEDGSNAKAREAMAYAQFLAGMAFNNASLGYVHAMAHQLGGFYNLPHGVCNAVLLPHVQAFNSKVAAARLRDCNGRERDRKK